MALILLLVFAAGTLRWPLISDAGLMHYISFLVRHGFAPYSQIVDPNLPGTYLLDLGWTQLFGSGALAWRLFDYALVMAAAAGTWIIARPYSRLAGVLAAALFALLHGADGVAHAGERDFVVAVLLLAGCACLFSALRRDVAGGGENFAFSPGERSQASPPPSSRRRRSLELP